MKSAHFDQLKIILIQPIYPSSPFPGPNLPIGLGYIAEQLELNFFNYEVIDLSIDSTTYLFEKIFEHSPEYIGFSLMSLDIEFHYQIIREIKKRFPNIKIVTGGPHISFIQAKAFAECPEIDFGVVCEGEYAIIELISGAFYQDIKGLLYRDSSGRIVYTGNRPFVDNLDQLPFPKFSKFKLSHYGSVISIASSRGCPFSCTFCGAFLSMGRKWRARSVINIISEIEYWHNQGYSSFSFVDSNFFMSKQRIIDLCDALESKNLKISLTSDGMRANDADRTMLSKLKKIGLLNIAIGIESANDDILQKIKKGETVAELSACLELLQELRINVIAFFIIGLPGETVRHVLNSFNFALQYPIIRYAYFFNPNPIPGTELFDLAEKNNLLTGSDSHFFQNIGGMGEKILFATAELSIRKRKILLKISKHVSRLVKLNHALVFRCRSVHIKKIGLLAKSIYWKFLTVLLRLLV